jgi:hypothetical protein
MEPSKAVQPAAASRALERPWVAWTRYPFGRWRRTFLGVTPEACLSRVRANYGESVETVVLPDGENPVVCRNGDV